MVVQTHNYVENRIILLCCSESPSLILTMLDIRSFIHCTGVLTNGLREIRIYNSSIYIKLSIYNISIYNTLYWGPNCWGPNKL